MGRQKKFVEFNLIDHIRRYFNITPYQPIIEWCQKNIDFSQQISAERNKLDFELYPYQVPIIKEWQNEKKTIKTIVVVAPEQLGKTNMFVDGILYNMVFNPCQSLIVYPNDDLAIATNQTKLKPLMKHIPILNEQLQKPKSCKVDCYKFTNLISYFQGAGVKIVSRSCKIVVGDQIDAWQPPSNMDPVADLKKRTRSYNNSICFLISTPTTENGRIWKNFLKGSQGYWFLRCRGCGQLTMKSCDIHNLQFESDQNQQLNERVVRPDSIRLICPQCGHEHTEQDKAWMNKNGGFKHLIPERLDTNPSFQIGALASQLPAMCWANIATAQLEAGKRADIEAQITFDNSYKGLPYKRRQIVKEDLQRLKDHIYANNSQRIKPEQIEFVFAGIDSMGTYFRYAIMASDVNDNIHVIRIGEVNYLTLSEEDRKKNNEQRKRTAQMLGEKYQPIETLEDIINANYYGFPVLVAAIDAHATYNYAQVQKFIRDHKNMVGYLGTKMVQTRYKPSQNVKKNFLVSASHYKVDLIYYLYSQKRRNSEYLFFDQNVEEKYWNEIAAVKPDPNSKFGHLPQNFSSENRQDHAFDAVKMGYWVRDLSIQNLQRKRFNYAKSPRLQRRFQKQLNKQITQTQKDIEEKNDNKSWFEGLR